MNCFSCGEPMKMTMLEYLTGWCDRCQVIEEQLPEPYVCRARQVTSGIFGEWEFSYLDHGAGHYPSPA